MSSISRIDQILQAMRAQALVGQGRLQNPPKQVSTDASKAPRTSVAASYVSDRIQAIRPDDPRRRRRAFRVFLEGGLVDLFGSDALSDPAFHRLVDQVDDAMRLRLDLVAAMDRVADDLLSGAAEGRGFAELTAAFSRVSEVD